MLREVDYDLDLDISEVGTEKEGVEDSHHTYETPTERNLVPTSGYYLGLDISKTGTGVTLYSNGIKEQWAFSVECDTKSPHWEVLMRRSLSSKLKEIVEGIQFDAIIIEDVFQGENPDTTRKLLALNTAIDELILDSVTSAKDFARVSNKTWKRWLSVVDSMGLAKGYNDKVKVQMYMEMLGIKPDTSPNFQDKLDSNGMILGYLLNASLEKQRTSVKKVSFSDLKFAYLLDTSELNFDYEETIGKTRVFTDEVKWTKDKVIKEISDNPTVVVITSSPVYLSLFMQKATGCTSVISDGGYFAFWVSPSKIKKYIKEV